MIFKKFFPLPRVEVNSVYYEISGFCNAKCPYCPTGNGSTRDYLSRFIPVEDFSLGLRKLYDLELLKKETFFGLFNWGDPMLHPRLDKILETINEYQQKFALSTNGSYIPRKINSELLENLNYLRVSLPGFSQDSYNKIHQLDFQLIQKNIKKISELTPSNTIEIVFYAYKFNLHEIEVAKKYFQDLDIKFSVNLPHTMNLEDSIGYLTESLSPEKKKDIDNNLYTDHIKSMVDGRKNEPKCPFLQKELVVDEYNKIVTCCAISKNCVDYEFGSLLDVKIEDIISFKSSGKPICKRCLSAGVPYWYTHNNEAQYQFIE